MSRSIRLASYALLLCLTSLLGCGGCGGGGVEQLDNPATEHAEGHDEALKDLNANKPYVPEKKK